MGTLSLTRSTRSGQSAALAYARQHLICRGARLAVDDADPIPASGCQFGHRRADAAAAACNQHNFAGHFAS
jgi:hypothetical protein